MPVGMLTAIDVCVRQIDAAAEGDPAIDDHHFAVRSIIDRAAHEYGGVERDAFDPARTERGAICSRAGGDAAQIIIHHPHIHAVPRLLRKYFQNFPPQHSIFNDKVFQIDEFFRRFQRREHRCSRIVAEPIEIGFFVAARGVAALARHHGEGLHGARIHFEFFETKRVLRGREGRKRFSALQNARPQRFSGSPVAKQAVQQRAGQRHCEDDQHPQHSVYTLAILIYDV